MDKPPKSVLFYDLCRLCLENPGAVDIFTKTDLVHDVFLCTGVNVRIQIYLFSSLYEFYNRNFIEIVIYNSN